MNKTYEQVIINLKDCYKESVLIENEKLQDILLNTLTEMKKLEEIDMNIKQYNVQKDQMSKRYTYEQVKSITKIQLELAKDIISYEVAEREIKNIASTFPVHNLRQYNKRLKATLSGIGTYGFAYPSNWAKALLEATNNDSLVITALTEQQNLYFKKDGKRNEKLDILLKKVENEL